MVNSYIDSVATEGLFKPLTLQLVEKGNLFSINSYHRLIISRILNLPSIPAYIVSANDGGSFNNIEDLSELANKELSPYFQVL